MQLGEHSTNLENSLSSNQFFLLIFKNFGIHTYCEYFVSSSLLSKPEWINNKRWKQEYYHVKSQIPCMSNACLFCTKYLIICQMSPPIYLATFRLRISKWLLKRFQNKILKHWHNNCSNRYYDPPTFMPMIQNRLFLVNRPSETDP